MVIQRGICKYIADHVRVQYSFRSDFLYDIYGDMDILRVK